MGTTIIMATTVAILNCTVKILLNDFVNIYSRCASMKLNPHLMQKVHCSHAKTTAQHFACTMLKYKLHHSAMCMCRSVKQLLTCYISVIINRYECYLWSLAEVRPQLAVICWNGYFPHLLDSILCKVTETNLIIYLSAFKISQNNEKVY